MSRYVDELDTNMETERFTNACRRRTMRKWLYAIDVTLLTPVCDRMIECRDSVERGDTPSH